MNAGWHLKKREDGSTYEEESSNDSVDPHLNGRARNAKELEQEECHAKLQRKSLRFMLANNQIDVAGYKVWRRLGKCLSNGTKGLMKEHVMKSAAFKPSKCDEAGRQDSQALQNHLMKHQQH